MVSRGRRSTVTARALLRQRPVTATSVVFITVEDETGVTNVVVWSYLFERQRHVVF
jgi:DNA polymerase III alpha subunit